MLQVFEMTQASRFDQATLGPALTPATVAKPLPTRMLTSAEPRSMGILEFAEADTVAGAGKPVLEFAREAARNRTKQLGVATVVFVREEPRSHFFDNVREEGIPIDLRGGGTS